MSFDGTMSPADISAVMGNNDGFGGNNGAFWIIILFLFAFCGWGNGGYGGAGAQNNYVLASDFATIQRQLSDGFGGVEKGIDTVRNGLCDGFYTEAQLVNGVNTNILTASNALQSQIAQCCCDVREGIAGVNYNMAMNTNVLQSAIDKGFCQTNYNLQNATRDITDNANANTKAILDFLVQDKIQTLQNENNALRLQASQGCQSAYLINTLRPTPIPAYTVPNPFEPAPAVTA